MQFLLLALCLVRVYSAPVKQDPILPPPAFIIGCQKCGVDFLFSALNLHPKVKEADLLEGKTLSTRAKHSNSRLQVIIH